MKSIFDIFQFITLIAFLFVFIGRSIYLYLRVGVNPLVLGVGKAGYRRFVELLFFVGLTLWIIEVAAYALDWEWHLFGGVFEAVLLTAISAKFVGMLMIVAGFTLFVLALVAFGQSWRVGIDEQSPGDLITHGVFGISRNPIFLFIDLYFVGTFLISGTVFFLLMAIVVVVGLHYQILQEERFLNQHYGVPYQAYCENVSRYLTLRRRVS
jgi:protein-S-isoprenylcysteine O-methyltransferase Ste14